MNGLARELREGQRRLGQRDRMTTQDVSDADTELEAAGDLREPTGRREDFEHLVRAAAGCDPEPEPPVPDRSGNEPLDVIPEDHEVEPHEPRQADRSDDIRQGRNGRPQESDLDPGTRRLRGPGGLLRTCLRNHLDAMLGEAPVAYARVRWLQPTGRPGTDTAARHVFISMPSRPLRLRPTRQPHPCRSPRTPAVHIGAERGPLGSGRPPIRTMERWMPRQ